MVAQRIISVPIPSVNETFQSFGLGRFVLIFFRLSLAVRFFDLWAPDVAFRGGAWGAGPLASFSSITCGVDVSGGMTTGTRNLSAIVEMSRRGAHLWILCEHAAEVVPSGAQQPGFQILRHVEVRFKRSGNYWTQCPSCAQQGRDRARDNLAISAADPRFYKCWAGCTREMIREALGQPVPKHIYQ